MKKLHKTYWFQIFAIWHWHWGTCVCVFMKMWHRIWLGKGWRNRTTDRTTNICLQHITLRRLALCCNIGIEMPKENVFLIRPFPSSSSSSSSTSSGEMKHVCQSVGEIWFLHCTSWLAETGVGEAARTKRSNALSIIKLPAFYSEKLKSCICLKFVCFFSSFYSLFIIY